MDEIYFSVQEDLFPFESINSNIDKFYILEMPKLSYKLHRYINNLLPLGIFCKLDQYFSNNKLVIKYYYSDGNIFLKEVPVIKKENLLYILKP